MDFQSELQTPQPNTDDAIIIYKSRARFAGLVLIFVFVLLVGITFLVLWYLETQRTGEPPDIQHETEQLIEEAKKELGQ